MPPQHPPGSEGSRRDGCGTRGQNRCPGAAAGPGRASRSTTPSRRLACGDLAGGPPPTGTWTIGSAAVTREALHPLGGAAPNQKGCNANRWGRAPIDNKRKCGLAACNNDLDSNVSRTRAACPARGRGRPDSEQQAHVRMRRPRLEITGLRALRRAWCRAAPLLSHAGRLSRTRAACPVRGRGCPDSE